jgi:hypothetical protein
MKILRESVKIIFLIVIPLLVIGLLSCKETAPAIEINGDTTERMIRIDAEGDVLHYQETLLWDEEKFLEILKEKSSFYENQVAEFKKTYEVDADNFEIKFIQDKDSTLLSCDVHGKFNEKWYDFHWFLNPLGLDFLDSPFEKSETNLSWEGIIEEKPTAIILEFPFAISNCHAHVWKEELR